ncbi:MAG: hypothetical protein JNN08_29675 [Bryobacterales bacterium]|nr:hypothetical protein [Bryobacterales bacterium]
MSLLKKTWPRQQWSDLKKTHAAILKRDGVVFKQDLGPIIDKAYEKYVAKKYAESTQYANQVPNILGSYTNEVRKIKDPKVKSLFDNQLKEIGKWMSMIVEANSKKD